jgi:hypothetical protein
MLRSSLAAVAFLAWSGAVYAQTAGSAVAGIPGGIWIDQDADGTVDAYLLNGEIHLSDGRVVSASPVAPPLAPGAVGVPANWAGLDRLVGKTFHNRKQSFVYIYTWRWLEPGKILAADWTIGASKGTEQWVIDPNTGLPVGYFLDPDGTLGTKPITVRGKTTRLTIKVLGPDAYETRVQVKKKGGWSTMAEGLGLFESEAALAARQQDSSGGGFGSILAGAAMGAILGGGGQSSVDLAVAGAQAAAQGGNTLDVLNSMGGVAAANAAESKRQLDETIARAQAGSSGGASIASTGSFSSSAGSAVAPGNPAHSLTRKTIQVYFEIGTTPKIATKDGEEDDGHNTHCQSTVFPVTIDWDPSLEASGGNLKYANPVLDGMKSAFIDKCNRTDPSRPTEGVAEWYADAFSGWNPARRQLRKGDLEVRMP